MRILSFIQIVAVADCGLMSGVLLGDRLGPTYARPVLTPSGFIVLQQISHAHYGTVLPKFMGCALAGALLWLTAIRAERRCVHFWLLALAAAAIGSAAAVTIHVNFPINDQLMAWNAAAPPDNLRQIWSTWEKAHTIRTTLWVGAFLLEVAALALATTEKSRTRTAALN